MKILQVINNLGSGGAEKLISDFVPKMAESGHQVDVLLIRDKNSIYTNTLIESSIKVTILNKSSLYNPFTIIKLYKYLMKNKYDVIHVHLFPALYYFYISSMFINKHISVFTEHAVSNDRQKYLLFRFFDSIIYNKFDKIICLSNKVMDNLIEKIKIESKKCTIIPNGIDLQIFNKPNKISRDKISEHLNINDFLVIMIARLTYQKDHITLIKAISILPEKYKLILVGEGENYNMIVSLIEEMKLEKRIILLGRRTDVPELISTCDIGVLSTRVEGMPLFALEVMAAKKPFVGSNVPGVQDLFSDAGIMFNFENYKELASIIKKLDEDKDLYKQYSNKSAVFCQNYSIEQMATNYLNLYNKIKLNEK